MVEEDELCDTRAGRIGLTGPSFGKSVDWDAGVACALVGELRTGGVDFGRNTLAPVLFRRRTNEDRDVLGPLDALAEATACEGEG